MERSKLEAAFAAFGLQPDFYLVMAEMVLDMALSSLMSVIPVRVGYHTS